jgi:hypothetical protein
MGCFLPSLFLFLSLSLSLFVLSLEFPTEQCLTSRVFDVDVENNFVEDVLNAQLAFLQIVSVCQQWKVAPVGAVLTLPVQTCHDVVNSHRHILEWTVEALVVSRFCCQQDHHYHRDRHHRHLERGQSESCCRESNSRRSLWLGGISYHPQVFLGLYKRFLVAIAFVHLLEALAVRLESGSSGGQATGPNTGTLTLTLTLTLTPTLT